MFWPQFCKEPNFAEAAKPDCYSSEFFNIVFTGNIGDAQGLDLLVDAAAKLRDTRVRWYIVGDGRARERLQKYVEDNALNDRVFFMGKVSEEEANRYIRFADCAYLSFMNNKVLDMTLPAKLQSYMACGAPIIVAAGGESASVVKEARCGFACRQDADELCKLIKYEVLECKDFSAMRTNARKYFDANFSMKKVIDDLENMMLAAIKQ